MKQFLLIALVLALNTLADGFKQWAERRWG